MRTDWIKDVIIGVAGIVLFAFMLLLLPTIMPIGFGYIAAFLVFVAFLVVMSLTVIKKQIGEKYIKKPKISQNKQ